MTNREKMFVALRQAVFPYLQAQGFAGKYPHFQRQEKDRIELISFDTDKSGGAFCICISVAFPERKNTNLGWYDSICNITAFHTIKRYRGMEMFEDSGYYYYSDVYKKCVKRNWWISGRAGSYSSYACALNETKAQELLSRDYDCIARFTDDTPMEVCNLILRQLRTAFLWIEKFDKKNR